jgi:predicted transcriptional regulator
LRAELKEQGYSKKPRDMELRKERSRWEIIQDILAVALEEKKAKKTRIMQKACLDWRNFKRYYSFLTEENLLAKCDPEKDCFELTEKGKDLLNRLKEVDGILRVK